MKTLGTILMIVGISWCILGILMAWIYAGFRIDYLLFTLQMLAGLVVASIGYFLRTRASNS